MGEHFMVEEMSYSRMQVILRLLVLTFLLSGCGGSRKSLRREDTIRIDSIRFSSRGTEVWQRDIHFADTAVWNIRRVVYTAPDSAGKQYPQTVTTLQMDYRRQLTDTGKVMMRKQDDYAGRRVEATELRAESRRTIRSPVTLYAEGFCCLSWASFFIKGCGAETFFLKVLFNKKRILNLHPD
ncbi:MAG: hypothetical protein LUH63_09460 [Parabacteroides sp.]|nr:hypothetical protein [Parabacteroides sp.]